MPAQSSNVVLVQFRNVVLVWSTRAREMDRVALVRKVVSGCLLQREAPAQLGLSVRQIQRLVRRYRDGGPAALVSKRRGRRLNNALDVALRREVLRWVRKRYGDFGPTFACEKLTEVHGYLLSVETLRLNKMRHIVRGHSLPQVHRQQHRLTGNRCNEPRHEHLSYLSTRPKCGGRACRPPRSRDDLVPCIVSGLVVRGA